MSENKDENKLPTLLTKPIRKSDSTPMPEETASNLKNDSSSITEGTRRIPSSGLRPEKKGSKSKTESTNSNIKNSAQKPMSIMQSNVTGLSSHQKNDRLVKKGKEEGVLLGESRSISGQLTRRVKRSNVNVGEICTLKISSVGPNGIGIDEYSYPFSIFIPNANLNDTIKAKILRVNSKGNKYAIAKVLKVKSQNENKTSKVKAETSLIPQKLKLQPNQMLTVNINKLTRTGSGIVNLKYGYKLIIPKAIIGTHIPILITRLKSMYGFAKIVNNTNNFTRYSKTSVGDCFAMGDCFAINPSTPNPLKTNLSEGSKYTLTLPKIAKKFGTYLFLKLQGSIIFLKLGLNAKPGDKVRIKITKVKNQFGIAKIIQINPLPLTKKRILIQNSIRQMIKNGMHLGEKAVKCHARMKSYVWLKKHGRHQKSPLIKKGNHIINLLKTRRCLNKALTQLTKYALKGSTFLFIGTKKAAAGLIARASLFSKNSFFVNTRWLGGLLTNWKTIRKSISKIRPILQEKQKIVADILEKRKRIQVRLIKKGLFIKNKTQLILKKGRSLLAKLKNPEYKASILEKTKSLILKQNELLENCQVLVSSHKALEIKRRKVMYQNIVLKQHIANNIVTRYNNLLSQLTVYTKKLRQLKYLLILSNELKKIKNKAHNENTKVLNIDNNKFKYLLNGILGTADSNITGNSQTLNLLPQPPKDIFNFILLTVKNNSKVFSSTFNETDFLNIETKNSTTNKAILISDFVSNLSRFVPDLKILIETYEENIKSMKNSLTNYSTDLSQLKQTLRQDVEFHQKLVNELSNIKTKLISQRHIIRLVKSKLNHFARQKRVIKFLPRLRHFKIPSFKNKIVSIVQILMRKIVDPKLKYPVDTIYDSKLNHYSKKIASARKKKWQRFEKYFGGISKMTEMTKSQISKNVAIVIGQKEEMNAIRECQKLGIKMFNIVDTNCNPTLADHIIPANDDSRNSIKYVLNKFVVRIRLAHKLRQKMLKKQNQNTEYKKLKTMANQMRQNLGGNNIQSQNFVKNKKPTGNFGKAI